MDSDNQRMKKAVGIVCSSRLNPEAPLRPGDRFTGSRQLDDDAENPRSRY
jgi:hypothetical protein